MYDLNKVYTWNDINELIKNKVEESTYLELKGGAALYNGASPDDIKNEISKDVSAIANADGGLLIYGVREKKHAAYNFSYVDGNRFSKEDLEQIISGISERIPGLMIDPIRNGGKIEESVYVVRIPRSYRAPHQSRDKFFYKRHNFIVLRMEQYEIRESYNRTEKTILEILDPKVGSGSCSTANSVLKTYLVTVSFLIKNIGNVIENSYKVEIKIPTAISRDSNVPSAPQPFFSKKIITDGDYDVFSFPNSSPLFQEEATTITTVELKVTERNYNYYLTLPIIIKLYSSSETKEIKFPLLPKLSHQPQPSAAAHELELKCFHHRE